MDYNVFVPIEKLFIPLERDTAFGGFCLLTTQTPSLNFSEIKPFMSEKELEKVTKSRYWLKFSSEEITELTPSEIVSLFLLTLWIIKPTKVKVCFRFEGKENTKILSFSKYHDFFHYNKKNVKMIFDSSDIQIINKLFTKLLDIAKNKKRLKTSIYLTLNGCMAFQWQVTHVLLCSAIESLLTYSDKKNKHFLTKRLATTFACLMSQEKLSRDNDYNNLKNIYKVRSDIVHGRSYTYKNPEQNLNYLSEMENILRKLWAFILNDDKVINLLNKSNKFRKQHFTKIISNYVPPK